MEVLNFMNTHVDWEEILTQPPYCIKVKRDGDYILLKYNQLDADFSIPIVRECRGAIFYDGNDSKCECVCRAFDKFGNLGESYVPEIDWNSAVVEEKVDGSLIKLYYHNNQWHIATSGTINAFKAEVDDVDLNFGDLVYEALGGEDQFKKFCKYLKPANTYMFELVSPKSRVTISYPETRLYYLGQRNMETMEESKDYIGIMQDFGILYPKIYPLHTLEDCLEYVKTMTKDQEGFVIRDKEFNRIKLKSPEYLLAFHMNNNGVITTKRIINMIKNEQIDDFLAYCPEYTEQVNKVVDSIRLLAAEMELSYLGAHQEATYRLYSRKELAQSISKNRYRDFIFERLDHPKLTAMEYIMNMPTKRIKRRIKECVYYNGD